MNQDGLDGLCDVVLIYDRLCMQLGIPPLTFCKKYFVIAQPAVNDRVDRLLADNTNVTAEGWTYDQYEAAWNIPEEDEPSFFTFVP